MLSNRTLATFSLFWTKCINNLSRYMTLPLAASQHNATWHAKQTEVIRFRKTVEWVLILYKWEAIWYGEAMEWRGAFLFCPHCKALFISVTRSSSVLIFYPLIFVGLKGSASDAPEKTQCEELRPLLRCEANIKLMRKIDSHLINENSKYTKMFNEFIGYVMFPNSTSFNCHISCN